MRNAIPGFVASLAVCVLLAGGVSAADLPAPAFDPVLDADPFAAEALLARPQSPAIRHYLQEIVAASCLDTPAALRHLDAALSGRGATPGLAQRALSIAGTAALRSGDYRHAADLLDRAISEHGASMTPQLFTEDDQSRGAAMALRSQPPQTIEKQLAGTIPLSINKLGLTTAPARIEGHDMDVVLDSGTSVSVLSTTAANALGLHMLSRKTSLSSATSRALDSTVAIADTVHLGPVTLHHVVFIVVDDATLSPLGPQSRIDAIIGMQVLAALGRISFHDDKPGATSAQRSLVLAPSARAAHAGNLRFNGFSPLVQVQAGSDKMTFFVDSGANKTSFDKRYGREFAERIAGLEHKTTKTAGAGGIEERQSAVIPAISLAVGDTSIALQNVNVDLTGSGPDDVYGSVGYDVLWARGGYTFDFGSLNLSLNGR